MADALRGRFGQEVAEAKLGVGSTTKAQIPSMTKPAITGPSKEKVPSVSGGCSVDMRQNAPATAIAAPHSNDGSPLFHRFPQRPLGDVGP